MADELNLNNTATDPSNDVSSEECSASSSLDTLAAEVNECGVIHEEPDGSFISSAEAALDLLNGGFLELTLADPFTNVMQVVHHRASESAQQYDPA